MTYLMGLPWIVKMGLSIAFDIIDWFGFLPLIGEVTDILGTVLAYVLWGPFGLVAVTEVIMAGPLNVVDSFIPIVTLSGGLATLYGGG